MTQLEDKLTKKSAVVAGIGFIVAVTGISAFSQWQPNHTIASSVQSAVNTSNRTPIAQITTPVPVFPSSKTTPTTTSTASSATPNKFSTPPSSSYTSNKTATDNPTTSKPPIRVQQTVQSITSSKSKSSEQARDDASASGLSEIKRQGKIKPETKTWKKAQLAISLMRQGKTRRQAARQAGISKATLKRFIESGQN